MTGVYALLWAAALIAIAFAAWQASEQVRLRRADRETPEAPAVFVDSDDPAALQVAIDALEALGFDVISMAAPAPMSAAEEADLLDDINTALGQSFRESREIHGMTVPEFVDVNEQFIQIVEANWPNQT